MRWFISICIALFMLGFAKVSSKDKLAPYIYYHSEALNAIVIERADGSDSHIIARNLMPVNHAAFSGPGWSPSGKWLAWTSTYYLEESSGPRRIWVMSADGKQRLAFLDSLNNVFKAVWSPTGDYLLIIEQSQSDLYSAQLVDVEKQRTVATLNDMELEFGADQSFWSEDGKSVQLGYPNVRVLHIDGRVENNVPAERLEPLVSAPKLDVVHNPISPDGNYEIVPFPTYFLPYIYNLKTHQTFTLRPFSGSTWGVCDFSWYPAGGWLLVNFNRTAAGGGCSDGGSSIVSVDGTTQRELGPCNWGENCANWLPEKVVTYLAPGQAISVVPDPMLTINLDGQVRGVAWNPDGIHLAAYSENYNGNVKQFILNIWDTSNRPAKLIHSYPVEECAELDYTPCKIIWNNAKTRIGLTGITHTQIIDVNTGQLTFSSSDFLAGFNELDVPILAKQVADMDYDSSKQWVASISWEHASMDVYLQNGDAPLYSIKGDENFYTHTSVAFVPNRNDIAFVGNPDEPVQGTFLWDLDTNKIDTLPKYALEYLNNVTAFDSQTIIGYGHLSLLYFWDVDTRQVRARLNRYVDAVDVTSDLTRMATGSTDRIEIWDYHTIVQQLAGAK